MSELHLHLARRIRAAGPLTVADYMAEALGHPRLGYYRRADPFGMAGDFITAPEVSQAFGELIGLWCVEVWRQMGEPAPVRLVELGPGRGTMMADALRAARVRSRFLAASDLHLVETSPLLRARQGETLAGFKPAWHDDFADVPDGPLLLLANEFFDALPIHQFQRAREGWRERRVDLAPDGAALRFVLTPPGPALTLVEPIFRAGAPLGAVAEVSPQAQALADAIARRVIAGGGAALVIDYADAGEGDSLQAVRRHATHDALGDPGAADLSARVDFAALARAARAAGAGVHGPLPQAELLQRLGIRLRAERLMDAAPAQAAEVHAGLERLLEIGQMGTLFKALAIAGPGVAPPGF